jgi:hypothetical protein
MSKKARSGKAQSVYQIYARLADGETVVKVGPPTKAPAWRATAMTSMIRDRADVANAWHKVVAA